MKHSFDQGAGIPLLFTCRDCGFLTTKPGLFKDETTGCAGPNYQLEFVKQRAKLLGLTVEEYRSKYENAFLSGGVALKNCPLCLKTDCGGCVRAPMVHGKIEPCDDDDDGWWLW